MNKGSKIFTNNVKKAIVVCSIITTVISYGLNVAGAKNNIKVERSLEMQSAAEKLTSYIKPPIEPKPINEVAEEIINEIQEVTPEVVEEVIPEVVTEEVVEEIIPEVVNEEIVRERTVDVSSSSTFSEEDIYLIAKVCLGEAEGESEYGQRLVISTILNRLDSDYYPDTISGVVYQPYQFEVMDNGRIDRVTVTDETLELVRDEINNRTNYDVIYFRMYHYSEYGTPLFKEGCHYFSSF